MLTKAYRLPDRNRYAFIVLFFTLETYSISHDIL